MNETEKQFLTEFKEFLKKWGVELSTEDHYSGYSECGKDIRMNAYSYTKYDNQGNIIREKIDIDLGLIFNYWQK